MTEDEADLKELRENGPIERFAAEPDFIFFDGDRPPRMFRPTIDVREIQADAIRFANAILFYSRTRKAGQLRLLGARHLVQ